MQRPTRTLSIDDQKAVDVCLDHAVAAGKTKITRIASPVPQKRLAAAGKILSLLSELPVVDPPAGLVSRTIKYINRQTVREVPNHPEDSISGQIIH